jgi:FMN phosphatase YigB (HAD superfamily)
MSNIDMLKVILFDLDNTLIHFDELRFFDEYIRLLAPWFSDLWPQDVFRRRLVESVQALLANDGKRTNMQCFMDHFSGGLGDLSGDLGGRFLRFYETDFQALRGLVEVPDGNPSLLSGLRNGALRLVIASNPVWPLLVQNIRLGWAGLEGFPFDWITHNENTHFCKPRIEYYSEICRELGVEPGHCLMVGNDPVNDMVVAEIGMHTFLIRRSDGKSALPLSDELRKGRSASAAGPDFQGTLADVPRCVEILLSRR